MTRITDTPITDAAWYSSDNNDDRCDALNQACEKLERQNAELRKAGGMLAGRVRLYNGILADEHNQSLLTNWRRVTTEIINERLKT
jgi:hypothetical protein